MASAAFLASCGNMPHGTSSNFACLSVNPNFVAPPPAPAPAPALTRPPTVAPPPAAAPAAAPPIPFGGPALVALPVSFTFISALRSRIMT